MPASERTARTTPAKEPGLNPPQASLLEADSHRDGGGKRYRPGSVELLAALLLTAVLLKTPLTDRLDQPALKAWATVFVSIIFQALPFLGFGVLLSAVIAVFVPRDFFNRALPKRPSLAVPVAGVAGVALPGCECAAVPIAGGLIRRGVAPSAALTFLLAAPAVNPIVLAATAMAFPGQPEMVWARFLASALASVCIGWLWLKLGKSEWIALPRQSDLDGMPRIVALATSVRHDVIHAGGFLVIGGTAAAILNVTLPPEWLQNLADQPVLAVVALGLLAVLLSICSEADAFVAASLNQFSPTARLAFLVVGPMIDLKLFAMQAGTFGRGFALRFAPATFVVAVLVSAVVGLALF
ncbi:permease [Streptomyces sp. NPDC003023]|uniref:permease n=1 Tax=Streptomyces sp. NPDC003023 TaxID=3364675 RepID=UPI003695A231